ncbi:PREDICTED: zinc finger protein Xfin isoform X1 [Drosophila arizonae]|uniref:Zinc finger protein Xfin isoform X1 n=1 Tax=Drosophila arizonae TaxID=7263 RepID=A0ABM1P6W4_DROAR|nr:PREDICTED: zinc finger protein Xfin isoform X1 [Drosophila arizonae]
MEGMDLWTSMFSADFDEGGGEMEGHNNGDNALADEFMGEEEEEEQEAEEDECSADERGSKQKGHEPDDDAIFDFELEPIVSIAEPELEPLPRQTAVPLQPPMPTGPAIRPQHRQSLPASFSSQPMVARGGAGTPSTRPTTSQINATDENGVPINYELGVTYICPACGAEYRQQDMWKRHMNQMHQYNTRRGLNFVAIDKLYHRCLECNKRIAMHSRENLLKHKFTHLPFRCTKCHICKREYKYRQDLMVHLRMVHCDEVVAMMRGGKLSAGRKTRVREPRIEQHREHYGQVHDEDGIEVKNEVLGTEGSAEAAQESHHDFEDEYSHTSNQAAVKKRTTSVGANGSGAADICEDYIHYMCPDCGTDCDTHAQWSQHIEFVHDYVSRRGLNFRCVDMQMQCLECKQFVIPNTIKTLRTHKFSHLPQPEWMRCKLCYKGFTEHHEAITHLLKQHNLETLMPENEEEEQPQPLAISSVGDECEENPGISCDDETSLHWDDVPRRGGRIGSDDMYEPHIDYLCPQCGREFIEKKHWRTHVVQVHGMNDLTKLNFEVINDRQLKCTECEKIITNAYGIQNAQQHRITHLPYKAYARCRKCHKSYTDRKGLVKHLATYHRVGYEPRKVVGSGAGVAPLTPNKSHTPRKQIVTVANETYEIIYLDEEQSPPSNNNINDENDFGEQMQADDDDYALGSTSGLMGRQPQAPTAVAPAPIPNQNRYKCVDCGSLFATQIALKTHISEEHDFMDTQYSAKKFDNAEPTEEAAAVPVAVSTTAASLPVKNTSGASTIEQNYIFLCPSCGKAYKTQFEWRRHINEEHNFDKRQYLNMRQLDKYRYQCTLCKDVVCNSKLKGLQDHHFRHLPYRLYLKCLVCGTCYNHKPNIAAHLRTRHNIYEREPSSWRDQHQKSQNGHEQHKHKDKDGDTQATAATVTGSASPTPSSSRTLKPQPGVLPTRPAGLNTLEDSISYHNAVDLDFITYFCPKCNKNFDSHAFWRKHIVEVHNYNSRIGLNFRQIDIHHYLCLECYKRVTVTHTKGAIGQLQSHKFRHLPYRSFKCLTCSGEFVRKQMFFKHLNRDTNRCDNKPLTGQENDEDTTDQPDRPPPMLAKETVDVATYRLMCPQCGDGFTTSSKALWREHINIHHGLGKREMLHMRKLGDELYRCTDCEEQLQTKQLRVLQQHRFQHLPYAAYIRCQLCEQQSPDGVSHGVAAAGLHSMRELQQHIRDVHPEVVAQDKQMQVLLDEEDDSQQPAVGGEATDSGLYMPLPPHLLDDAAEDVEFEEQYLLG